MSQSVSHLYNQIYPPQTGFQLLFGLHLEITPQDIHALANLSSKRKPTNHSKNLIQTNELGFNFKRAEHRISAQVPSLRFLEQLDWIFKQVCDQTNQCINNHKLHIYLSFLLSFSSSENEFERRKKTQKVEKKLSTGVRLSCAR